MNKNTEKSTMSCHVWMHRSPSPAPTMINAQTTLVHQYPTQSFPPKTVWVNLRQHVISSGIVQHLSLTVNTSLMSWNKVSKLPQASVSFFPVSSFDSGSWWVHTLQLPDTSPQSLSIYGVPSSLSTFISLQLICWSNGSVCPMVSQIWLLVTASPRCHLEYS